MHTRPYHRESIMKVEKIELSSDKTSLIIETPRLRLESVSKADIDAYCEIFCNDEVMQMYANGDAKTRDWVESRLDAWSQRWEKGFPFSAMKIALKKGGEIIGHIVMGVGSERGCSEIAFAFKQTDSHGNELWGKRFATEALNAVVDHFAPLLKNLKVTLDSKSIEDEGIAFEKLTATARPENKASAKLLENFLGKPITIQECGGGARGFDDVRNMYCYDVPEKVIWQVLVAEQSASATAALPDL